MQWWQWHEINDLPISVYRKGIEQAINQMSAKAGGKFEMMSSDDNMKKILTDVARLRAEGKIK